ncbi:hypothetical protein M422DRAFT_259889 [Sphaerobolus stellatus SS14]|uniref:Uncharacterized protein n=1 Tax=Sphaerobolus stellatus (strain SS14) TaxID=990650 RepID=A0A0C9VJI4_SPHS4|nr:hypothetical protein M422DRAFT_259889 [Sphaerobolus stellatus SS14]
MAPQLRYLGTLDLSATGTFDRGRLKEMLSLQSVAVTCPEDAHLSKLCDAVPGLQRLYFLKSPTAVNYRVLAAPSETLYKMLARFNKLTHLGGTLVVLSFHDKSRLDTYFEWMGSLPSLRYIEAFIGQEETNSRWITIKRDEDGNYNGWEFTEDLTDVAFDDWGQMFWGITD